MAEISLFVVYNEGMAVEGSEFGSSKQILSSVKFSNNANMLLILLSICIILLISEYKGSDYSLNFQK